MRGARRAIEGKCERQSEISGRSLAGRALPEVGTRQFPWGGPPGPVCCDSYLYLLNSHPSTLQAGPAGCWSGSNRSASSPPPTQGRPAPNLGSLCLRSQRSGERAAGPDNKTPSRTNLCVAGFEIGLHQAQHRRVRQQINARSGSHIAECPSGEGRGGVFVD